MPHVILNENPNYYDPNNTLVMDSKGLFDALDNDLPQDDRKSALEVPIIEEFMRSAMCRPRRCPHNRNCADAMTKIKGAHTEPLFNLLETGMYTFKSEKSELADRANQRQTGTVPRHKVTAILAATERNYFVHMSLDDFLAVPPSLRRAQYFLCEELVEQQVWDSLTFSNQLVVFFLNWLWTG